MERFDAYMERCLYGPDGFYTAHGVAGRARGDFITSPEVGPLFGAVIANALDAWWEADGQPDIWTVYDVGCGPNKLLGAVRRARSHQERPWRLIGVDRVRSAPSSTADSGSTAGSMPAIPVLTELPADLTDSVVLANELLDNLPFRIVKRSSADHWSEVHVEAGMEVLVPTDVHLDIPVGTRAPHLDRAAQWCQSVLERNPSRVCLFDYGAPTTAELAVRGGWLRTYRRHQRGDDPLADPGHWDITTDIAVDQFPPGAQVKSQTEFLRRWGIDSLVDEGREYWKANAARPDLTAMAMRSRVSEAEALTDPSGLGSWLVLDYPTT